MRRRKPLREKHKKRKLRNKLIYGIVAVGLVLTCVFAYSLLHSENPSPNDQTSSPKAALIDHLSFSSPPRTEFEKDQWNAFKNQCKLILEDAGFSYTYHKGEEVTVNFYKELPTYGYSLMLLRVHSAAIKDEQGNPTELIGLFTSEIWNETTKSKYSSEIDQGRLARARLFAEKDDWYFGITPLFVQSDSMIGNFKNTVIIMMGCEGLNHTSMADAFVHWKKATVYTSWTGLVSISHTDQSTIQLLQSLLEQERTIKNAVEKISPDPTWPSSELDYYPKEGDEDVGNYKIQDFISGLTTNVGEISMISFKSRSRNVLYFHELLSKRQIMCVKGKTGFSVFHSVSKRLDKVDRGRSLR